MDLRLTPWERQRSAGLYQITKRRPLQIFNYNLQIISQMDKLIGQYRFSMNHQIGQGSYGRVYKGKQQNGQPVAIKVIDKRILNQDSVKQLQNEKASMKNLDHPNIIRFLDYFETQNNIYLVQEYCDGGDLRDLIRTGKKDCATVVKILVQILTGYHELYKNQIIHRDIKPANILIHQGVIKLADFGFAKKIDFDNEMMTSVAGTPLYMAPQLILRQQYTAKCDIWSIGMIAYELLFQRPPIKAHNLLELQEQIENPVVVPPLENEKLREIIQQCLQVSEEKRISWEELYDLPLFKAEIAMKQSAQVEDFYMKKINDKAKEQSNENYQNYTSFMIQNYLKGEFQNYYRILMNHLDFVRCIYNFSLFILQESHQVKSEYVYKLQTQLVSYALSKLVALETPTYFRESQKFSQSEIGAHCLKQISNFRIQYFSKYQELAEFHECDQDELMKSLSFACDQIQQTQISHQKLCFVLMAKIVISTLSLLRECGPSTVLQIIDIQQILLLSDSEIIMKLQHI